MTHIYDKERSIFFKHEMFLCQSIASRIPVNDQKSIFKILVLNPTLLNSKNPSHTTDHLKVWSKSFSITSFCTKKVAQISDRKSKNILKYIISGKVRRATWGFHCHAFFKLSLSFARDYNYIMKKENSHIPS